MHTQTKRKRKRKIFHSPEVNGVIILHYEQKSRSKNFRGLSEILLTGGVGTGEVSFWCGSKYFLVKEMAGGEEGISLAHCLAHLQYRVSLRPKALIWLYEPGRIT